MYGGITKRDNLIVVVIYLISLTKMVYADDVTTKTVSYNEAGISLFNQGKMEEAVSQFVTALIIAPTDGVAQEYLRKIVSSSAALPIPQKHRVERFMELLSYIEFLESRLNELKQDNSLTQLKSEEKDPQLDKASVFLFMKKDLIAQQPKNLTVILAAYDRYKDSLVDKILALEKSGERLHVAKMKFDFRNNAGVSKPLRQMNESKRGDVAELRQELVVTQQKFEALKKDAQEKDQRISLLEDQLQGIQRKLPNKDKLMEEQEKNLNILKLELAHLQQKFVAVRNSVQHSEQHIQGVKKQFTEFSLDLVDKDKIIRQKDDQIAHLSEQIQEIQARVLLVQRIIQEKDEGIQALNETFRKNKENYGEQIRVSQNQIKILQGELSALKRDLKKQIWEHALQRKALQHFVVKKFETVQRYRLQAKDYTATVNSFKKSLLARDARLADLDNVLSSQDKKLLQLNGILEIYKGKFVETYKTLKERNEKIMNMERELEGLQKQIQNLPQPPRGNPSGNTNTLQSPAASDRSTSFEQRLNVVGRN